MPSKSIPAVPVGELRFHGCTVYSVSFSNSTVSFSSSLLQMDAVSFASASKKQKGNAVTRETSSLAGAARSDRDVVIRLTPEFFLQLRRECAEVRRFKPHHRPGARARRLRIRAPAAPVTRHPFAVSNTVTCFSCCSKLRFAKDCEKSSTAKRPPVPRTMAMPTAVIRGSRIFRRWPGESIHPA